MSLSHLPCFLPQRSWPVNCRAVRTNAWCCTAVWSAGLSATRCPASCSWKSESTTDTFSIWFLNGLNINSNFGVKSFHLSNAFSVLKMLVIFCFSPQPWRLAVLHIVLWLFVPPYWSELGTSARRSSVSRKFTILNWERLISVSQYHACCVVSLTTAVLQKGRCMPPQPRPSASLRTE